MTEIQNNSPQAPSAKLHFIGIGGSGMAPLAEVAWNLGFQVSGSDSSHSETTSALQSLGIKIAIGNSPKNISAVENPTVIYSSAIQRSNPEFEQAIARRLPLMHRSDLLNYFLSLRTKSVTVAGTNGKSTTSAMISYLLYQLGKDPLAIVGAKMRNFSSIALSGKGNYAVGEADESDGTFLKYRPYVGVLTSIDLDHMDYYKDHDHIFQTFKSYISNIHPDGAAVLNLDDVHCSHLNKQIRSRKTSYGFHSPANIQGSNYVCKNGESYFSIDAFGKTYAARIKSIGQHNVENALASIATAHALDFDLKDAIGALEGFEGVKRRLELIYKSPTLSIYDDYAHNPTKISSVLKALRSSCPSSNIVVIFQPHRYSRIKTLYNNFVGSFSNANCVMVLPIYSSGEKDDNPVLSETLVSDIEKYSKVPCFFAPTFESVQERTVETLKNDTIIITLGAGDVWQLAFKLKERLA